MNPSTLLSICFMVVASSSLLVSQVNADLYQLVLYSNSEDALDAAAADSSAILQDWIDDEPWNGDAVAVRPGQSVTANDGGGGLNRERGLQIGCPSRCFNSASSYCRLLGCANCGASCDRRNFRRSLNSVGRSLGAVESKLNAALAPYCTDAGPDCHLYVKILKV
jgi:hypothetical protein